jgi:hypothetical protein
MVDHTRELILALAGSIAQVVAVTQLARLWPGEAVRQRKLLAMSASAVDLGQQNCISIWG